MKNRKVLLFSRDPGGANVIFPLLKPLEEKGYEVILFGKDSALTRYNIFKLKGLNINDFIDDISIHQMKKFLLNIEPDFIITATSADDFTERYIWIIAKELGIPSFAILDQWMNYGIRFSNYNLSEIDRYKIDKNHPYLPTKILVMDQYAEEQFIKEGIKKDKILISGQPYFDYLIKNKELYSCFDINEFKDNICGNDKDILITFASEDTSKVYEEKDDLNLYWGYNEKTIFIQFIKVVNSIVKETEKKIHIVIRLHPKEDENNYEELIKNFKLNEGISITVDNKLDGFKLMMASDLICGMSSMFLLESVIIGRPILSIQIGLNRNNPFILSEKGVIKTILSKDELQLELKSFIIDDQSIICNYNIEIGAIDNVITYMEELLN